MTHREAVDCLGCKDAVSVRQVGLVLHIGLGLGLDV